MGAGLPKYVVVNLSDLEKSFDSGAEVTLDAIREKNILNISGREAKLPLKVGVMNNLQGTSSTFGVCRHNTIFAAPPPFWFVGFRWAVMVVSLVVGVLCWLMWVGMLLVAGAW